MEYQIILYTNDFRKYLTGNTIEVYDFNLSVSKSLKVNLIEDIVKDSSNLFILQLSLKDEEVLNINIVITNNKTKSKMKVNKIILLLAIIECINRKNIDTRNDIKNICEELIKTASYKNISTSLSNFTFIVSNKTFTIPSSNFLSFFTLDEDIFQEKIQEKELYDIPSKYFIYGLVNYLESNLVLSKHLFPSHLRKRLKKIKNMEYIDYENINQILKTTDPYLDKIKLNPNLELEILKDKDKYDNVLDFIIQTYIKLCHLFTYDPIYYTGLSFDLQALRHEDISYLEKINKDNHEIVCYEFISIFAYFLNKLGIHYQIKQHTETYGSSHNYLIFKYQDFIIKVDAVVSVMESDLTNVKIQNQLTGIVCKNKSSKTRKEFLQILANNYKIQNGLKEEELPKENSFSIIPNSQVIKDILTKLSYIIKEVSNKKLEIVDAINYFFILKNKYIREEDNFEAFVIRQDSNPLVLMCLNPVNIFNPDNIYILFDGSMTRIIHRNMLKHLFNHNDLDLFNNKFIPGLELEEIKRIR